MKGNFRVRSLFLPGCHCHWNFVFCLGWDFEKRGK